MIRSTVLYCNVRWITISLPHVILIYSTYNFYKLLGMTLESLDSAVEKCLVEKKGIQVGISSQYFYRSLYAVQLHNCFKVVK